MPDKTITEENLLDGLLDKLDKDELRCINSIILKARGFEDACTYWQQQCAHSQLFLAAVIRHLGGIYKMKALDLQSTPMDSVVAVYPIEEAGVPFLHFKYSSDAASTGGN